MIWDHKSVFGFSQKNAPLVITSHPHFVMGSYHLSRAVFQNKTIIVGHFYDIDMHVFELLKIMLKPGFRSFNVNFKE